MKRLSIILLISVMYSCKPKEQTLFTRVEPTVSGIEFKNLIPENESINILELEYMYNGGGVSLADFNNDGLLDIFFTGNLVGNKLYLNKGNFKFQDVSDRAGIEGLNKWKSGAAVVDINHDGWLDLYVCATISGEAVIRKNMLFVNQGLSTEGVPTFIDQAGEYGIDYAGFSTGAGFFDYDADGDLDLYILTNYRQSGIPVVYRPKINDGSSSNTDKLFRNNDDGTFTDVSNDAGILCEGYGLGLSFLDVNKDGLTDIYVGNDYITNDLLYINKGHGKFQNEIDLHMKHQSRFSMGNDAADINNDGYLDLITLDMLPEINQRRKTVISSANYTTYIYDKQYGYTHQHVRNMLQLNNGNGTFSEIGQLAGVYATEWSWSPLFADFDNDGYKDLVVTNGYPRDVSDRDFINFRKQSNGKLSKKEVLQQIPAVEVSNYAFKNNGGNLTFSDVSQAWGFRQKSFSNGAAYGDLDNDGDLDYIVNNINGYASVYRNNLYTADKTLSSPNHYIRLKLLGKAKNASGIGTKVTLYYAGSKIQYAEHTLYRGYISTVEDVVHFGLGKVKAIDSVLVEWPGGRTQQLKNVPVNQLIEVKEINAQAPRLALPPTPATTLVSRVPTRQSGIRYVHVEQDYIDFNIQRTLPHKFSQRGPALAVGDINGDDLEDFLLGGSAHQPIQAFLQRKNGTFAQKNMTDSKPEEDTGLLLFDADQDGDLDLYATSGSIEYEFGSKYFQDRLYQNDGLGNFRLLPDAIPSETANGSCVRACDFDQDGDLDLFVGGIVPTGHYPFPDESLLLQNNGAKFINVTNTWSNKLERIGMVTDALWSDYNNDGKPDLIIVGEYMAVTFFKNTGKTLEINSASGIEHSMGWFNSIQAGDFDKDGDMDFVAGNLGLNNYFNAAMNRPVTVYAKDFDGNGSIDPITSCYAKDKSGEMKSFPIHYWEDLNSQSPLFRRKFTSFKEYSHVTTDQFFTPQEGRGAVQRKATFMATCFIENKGSDHFSITPYGNLVQTAPVNGIVVDDLNQDGNLDIMMVGNDYSYEPNAGQFDAFTGMILLGNGKGSFSEVPSAKSGFFVPGDGKGLAKLSGASGDLYIASQNKDSLCVFSATDQHELPELKPGLLDIGAEFHFQTGEKQKVEFYYGSGYASQSTRRVRIPKGVKEVFLLNSKGESRKISQPELKSHRTPQLSP